MIQNNKKRQNHMVLPKAACAPMRIGRLPAPMTDSTARILRILTQHIAAVNSQELLVLGFLTLPAPVNLTVQQVQGVGERADRVHQP